MRRRRVAQLALAATYLSLAACGLSKVGNQTQTAPTATAATVAQPYTTDAGGELHTTVRSGADVVLTGTNSEKGPTNDGLPIISYAWSQLSSDTTPVDLIVRAADTVTFTAPQVQTETVLNFQLTVADAKGVTGTTKAHVTVEPVRDPDHFLAYLGTTDAFTLTAVPTVAIPAPTTPGTDPTATIPFTVTVTKLVSFTDIDGVAHDGTSNPMVQVGTPTTYTSGWSQALGAGASDCADQRNPQIQIPIPKLNLDEKLADGSGHRLFDVLESSDVDRDPSSDPTLTVNPLTTEPARAIVYAQISIQSAAPLASGGTAAMCVNGVLNTASATVKRDDLAPVASATVLLDNSVSSHGYYAAIDPVTDPSTAKNTLTKWLSANGFNPNVQGWSADAHAVYTNNFDLGFGRDMYMKVGNCDAGANAAAAATLQSLLAQAQQSTNSVPTAVGQCDIAAVVVNYVSLQAAANRLNPINAVAMEYSAVAGQGARIVKFYAFAPDTRTGAFQRVASVDLDHRGQKSLPQSCVVCHGGTPGTAVTNSSGVPTGYTVNGVAGGNLNAGFISWDLDSFLYSDTDPGFSQKAQDADLKATYTRANEEPQLKLLNFGAYLTFGDANRFALCARTGDRVVRRCELAVRLVQQRQHHE